MDISSLVGAWISPACIIFIVIIIGYYLGQIRVCGVSLDLSGVLITAILFGIGVYYGKAYDNSFIVSFADGVFLGRMSFLSSLGTALFVSVIGISSGYKLLCCKDAVRSCLIGTGFVTLNYALMRVIAIADSSIDSTLLRGVFCGSMTSTPGLAAVNEGSANASATASAGYGCAYLFGVIGVVLFVQIIGRKDKSDLALSQLRKEKSSISKSSLDGIIQIAMDEIKNVSADNAETEKSNVSNSHPAQNSSYDQETYNEFMEDYYMYDELYYDSMARLRNESCGKLSNE